MDSTEFVRELRTLADFYEKHPDFPVPNEYNHDITVVVWNKETFAKLVRQMGRATKDYSESYAHARRGLLKVMVPREAVCRKVVTGTEVVPAREEYTREIVEWVCDEPILKAADNG